MAHSEGSIKAIFYALGANGGIAVAKGAAAWYTGSGAMLAEAVPSTADCANQLLLLLGLKRAAQPCNEEHPLGYGKAIYFWSFIVALMLFSMGGIFSVYEGIHKIRRPEMPESPWVAISVLLVSIVLEAVSLKSAIREVNRVRGSRSFVDWFRTSRQSELIVVTGEDIAALFGLFFALVSVAATMITGNPLYDALGTVSIGLILLGVAGAVGYEVKSLLIGESAAPETVTAMKAFLAARPEVGEVYRLVTLQLGREVMVAAKVRMTQSGSALQLVEDINRVEAALRVAFPETGWIFFEPDIRD